MCGSNAGPLNYKKELISMNKTARQHSSEMHNKPFRGRFAGWHKVRGYLVKTDEAGNVARGHIFAVEIHGGIPKVYSYTRRGLSTAAQNKSYSIKTLNSLLTNSKNWESHEIDELDFSVMLRKIYPDEPTPRFSSVCIEFGMLYNNCTKTIDNFVKAAED